MKWYRSRNSRPVDLPSSPSTDHCNCDQQNNHHHNNVMNYTEHQQHQYRDKLRDKDGGWAYMVAIAAFSVAVLLDGVENSFGVLMPYLLHDLDSNVALTSFCGGVITGVCLILGPLSAKLIARFGCRPVAFTGGLIASTGVILCTLSVNIQMFVMFYGVMTGLGIGLLYLPSITIINTYFDRKRGLVLGIVTSGSGVGLLVMSILIEFLVNFYGWRGAYLIIGGIYLNLCVCAALMRPLNPIPTVAEIDVTKNNKMAANPNQISKDGEVCTMVKNKDDPSSISIIVTDDSDVNGEKKMLKSPDIFQERSNKSVEDKYGNGKPSCGYEDSGVCLDSPYSPLMNGGSHSEDTTSGSKLGHGDSKDNKADDSLCDNDDNNDDDDNYNGGDSDVTIRNKNGSEDMAQKYKLIHSKPDSHSHNSSTREILLERLMGQKQKSDAVSSRCLKNSDSVNGYALHSSHLGLAQREVSSSPIIERKRSNTFSFDLLREKKIRAGDKMPDVDFPGVSSHNQHGGSSLSRLFMNVPPECMSQSTASLHVTHLSPRADDCASLHYHPVSTNDLDTNSCQHMDCESHLTQHRSPSRPPSALSLLKDPCLVLFCLSAFLIQLAASIAPMFAPSYARSLGFESMEAANVVSVLGISNTVGRLVAGLMSFCGVHNLLIYSVGTSLAGLMCFLLPLCMDYWALLAFAVGHGLFLGVFPPLQSVILVELLGLERLPSSFGIMCFCKSIASMAGPSMAGGLYQLFSDYTVPFLFAGGIISLANLLHLLLALLRWRDGLLHSSTPSSS